MTQSKQRGNLWEVAPEREKCLLVGLELKTTSGDTGAGFRSADDAVDELAGLARAAGARVLGQTVQGREKPDAATWIGRGKVEELHAWAGEAGADFVLFDRDLSPSQQRNLERALECKVIDRTQLILDIFARHARTREGKLQVELAQLSYMLPRLTGRGVELSRLGGGIGTRGPGETKLETDRRRIATRISKLKGDLEKVRRNRELQRKKRTAVPLPTIALVGYTNAGKSTLFNALTRAKVVADARMFATLDPTIRTVKLPSGAKALLSDTVGFIRGLPPGLVQAFRATLEEVVEAALLVHVVDASAEHREEQIREVTKVLSELDATGKPQILAFNKTDLLEDGSEAEFMLASKRLGADKIVAVSARSGFGFEELLLAMEALLPGRELLRSRFLFPHDRGDQLAFLYEHGEVLERLDQAEGVEVLAEVPTAVRDRMTAFLVDSDRATYRRPNRPPVATPRE